MSFSDDDFNDDYDYDYPIEDDYASMTQEQEYDPYGNYIDWDYALDMTNPDVDWVDEFNDDIDDEIDTW